MVLLSCLARRADSRWARFVVYPGEDEGEKPTQMFGHSSYQSHTQGRAGLPADDSLHSESEVNVLPKWWESKTDTMGNTYYFSHLTQSVTNVRPTIMASTKERPVEHSEYNTKGQAARDFRIHSGGGGAEAARDALAASDPKHGGPQYCLVPMYTMYFKTDTCLSSSDNSACNKNDGLGKSHICEEVRPNPSSLI